MADITYRYEQLNDTTFGELGGTDRRVLLEHLERNFAANAVWLADQDRIEIATAVATLRSESDRTAPQDGGDSESDDASSDDASSDAAEWDAFVGSRQAGQQGLKEQPVQDADFADFYGAPTDAPAPTTPAGSAPAQGQVASDVVAYQIRAVREYLADKLGRPLPDNGLDGVSEQELQDLFEVMRGLYMHPDWANYLTSFLAAAQYQAFAAWFWEGHELEPDPDTWLRSKSYISLVEAGFTIASDNHFLALREQFLDQNEPWRIDMLLTLVDRLQGDAPREVDRFVNSTVALKQALAQWRQRRASSTDDPSDTRTDEETAERDLAVYSGRAWIEHELMIALGREPSAAKFDDAVIDELDDDQRDAYFRCLHDLRKRRPEPVVEWLQGKDRGRVKKLFDEYLRRDKFSRSNPDGTSRAWSSWGTSSRLTPEEMDELATKATFRGDSVGKGAARWALLSGLNPYIYTFGLKNKWDLSTADTDRALLALATMLLDPGYHLEARETINDYRAVGDTTLAAKLEEYILNNYSPDDQPAMFQGW